MPPKFKKEKSKTEKNKMRQIETSNKTPIAVLFVERTHLGELAQRLRHKETEINRVGTKRVKIVEKNCEQVQSLFTRTNPCGERRCETQDCVSCTKREKDKVERRDTNLVYASGCKICKKRERQPAT